MRVPQAIPSRARWAVPVVAVVAVAGTVLGTVMNVAQAAPRLPARTPAQLITAVADATPPPLTGSVVETSSLGIPQLPGLSDQSSFTSLLAGSHTVNVWYGGPEQVRLSIPVQMGETDLIQNHGTVWLWQSRANSVTKLTLPKRPDARAAPKPHVPLLPQQAANQALAAIGKTTRVTTESNAWVAGQAAYQLVLAPKDSRSLIGKVAIAVDAQHPAVVLRVQVFARGARTPAIQVGYTSISFVTPGSANFNFTPPKGTHVRTSLIPDTGVCTVPPAIARLHAAGGPLPKRIVIPKRIVMKLRGLPHGVTIVKGKAVAGAHTVTAPNTVEPGLLCAPGLTGMAPSPAEMSPPQVIGRGWTSVLVLPSGALGVLGPLGGMGGLAGAVGQSARSVAGSGGPVSGSAAVGALFAAAHPVHGTWGSGRLLTTSLLSILTTSDGHVLVGSVNPSVLYAAASHVK